MLPSLRCPKLPANPKNSRVDACLALDPFSMLLIEVSLSLRLKTNGYRHGWVNLQTNAYPGGLPLSIHAGPGREPPAEEPGGS